MDSAAFNSTMTEFIDRLSMAFPTMPEISQSAQLLISLASSSPDMPAALFAEHIRPFAKHVAVGDYSFLDTSSSPLNALGLGRAWAVMHPETKTASLQYINKLVQYSGALGGGVVPVTPSDPMEGQGMNPAMLTNLFNMARQATSGMSENDAKALVEGRDSKMLGDICFGIIDSLTRR